MTEDPTYQPGVNWSRGRIAFTNSLAEALPGVRYESIKNRWRQDAWTTVEDVTIKCDKRTLTDIEFKSPIFRGDELVKLQQDLNVIGEAGLQTNDSCGLHIHIGRVSHLAMSRLDRHLAWSPDELIRFAESFIDNLDAITDLCDPQRLTNSSCRLNTRPDPDQVAKVLSCWRNEPHNLALAQQRLGTLYCPINRAPISHQKLFQVDPLTSFPIGSKNYALTLEPLISKSTVEIRLRQAADFQDSIPFIGMLLHMAQAAIDDQPFTVADYAKAVANNSLLALDTMLPSKPSMTARLRLMEAAQR